MVELGSGSQREIEDVALRRYACYLVAQNGDPSKSAVALMGLKQEALADRLGDEWSQRKISILESHETIEGIARQIGGSRASVSHFVPWWIVLEESLEGVMKAYAPCLPLRLERD